MENQQQIPERWAITLDVVKTACEKQGITPTQWLDAFLEIQEHKGIDKMEGAKPGFVIATSEGTGGLNIDSTASRESIEIFLETHFDIGSE